MEWQGQKGLVELHGVSSLTPALALTMWKYVQQPYIILRPSKSESRYGSAEYESDALSSSQLVGRESGSTSSSGSSSFWIFWGIRVLHRPG